MWANIQEYDDPSQVSFDFSNSKQWRPLFSPTPAQPLASVQQELHYSETDLAKVQELQDRWVLSYTTIIYLQEALLLILCVVILFFRFLRIERSVRERRVMTLRNWQGGIATARESCSNCCPD